jgi:II/X family phage/plasmid replication protein
MHQIKDAKKKKKHEVIPILTKILNKEFVKRSLRFEAELKREFLKKHCCPNWPMMSLAEKLSFLDNQKVMYLGREIPVPQYLFEKSFEPIFKALKGHTMKDLSTDEAVLAQLLSKYKPAKSERLYAVYKSMKDDGFKAYKSRYKTESEKRTFRNHVKGLVDAGISRSYLNNLKQNQKTVRLVDVITIDFNQQLPTADYQSPALDLERITGDCVTQYQVESLRMLKPFFKQLQVA